MKNFLLQSCFITPLSSKSSKIPDNSERLTSFLGNKIDLAGLAAQNITYCLFFVINFKSAQIGNNFNDAALLDRNRADIHDKRARTSQ